MDEQEKFMAASAAELASLGQQIAASQVTFEALQGSQYLTDDQESEVFWAMRRWPNKLAEVSACVHSAGASSGGLRPCRT